MCLSHTTGMNNGFGYKLMKKEPGKKSYIFPFMASTPKVRLNRWIHDTKKGLITAEDYERYPTGFHILLNLSEVEQFSKNYCLSSAVLCKVEYKNIVAFGTQDHLSTVVVKSFRIVCELERNI